MNNIVDSEVLIRDLISSKAAATGSRYWNSVDPDLIKLQPQTDFDFVVSENDELVNEVVCYANMLGSPIKNYDKYDLDPSTKQVLIFGSYTQLIVKYDNWYKAYMIVQGLMTPTYYHNNMWKSNGIQTPIIRERYITLMKFFMNDNNLEMNMESIR